MTELLTFQDTAAFSRDAELYDASSPIRTKVTSAKGCNRPELALAAQTNQPLGLYSMFRLFASRPFKDRVLGSFQRARGLWRGTLALAGTSLPLSISGTRSAPDAAALAIARLLPATWSSNRELVAQALIEHRDPYPEAVERTADVWQSVTLLSASVTPLDGKLTAEIALAVTWDEEHTLGARFQGPAFVELNGSILPED